MTAARIDRKESAKTISVRRFARVTSQGALGATSQAGVSRSGRSEGRDEGLARDLAMHVARRNPAYIDANGVPPPCSTRSAKSWRSRTKRKKKAAGDHPKMGEGRCAKYLGITLVGQPLSRIRTSTVEKLLEEFGRHRCCNSCAMRWARGMRKETG